MLGKGRITIDDIAKGVKYNEEPYCTNANFSVITPDIQSQQKFFTVNNYTHKYLAKEKRSPIVEYVTKRPRSNGCSRSYAAVPKETSALNKTTDPDPKPEVEMNFEKQVPSRHKSTPKANSVHNRSVSEDKQPASRKRSAAQMNKPLRRERKHLHIPKHYSITHPKELYQALDDAPTSPFIKANPFTGSKYYNMLTVLNMDKTKTLKDVLVKCQESESYTEKMIKLQNNKQLLKDQCLPPLPRSRMEPRVTRISVEKNVAKKIANEAHIRMTNGGFARTTYGGYYMH